MDGFISVLIATFSREDLLEEVLRSLEKQTAPHDSFEVLIADNACRDASEQLCNSFRNRLAVTYVPVPERGKNKALNALLPIARGELYLFTDDDIIADPDWIEGYRTALLNYRGVCLFAGKVLPNFAHGDDFPRHPLVLKYANAGNWDLPEGPIDPVKLHGTNFAVRRQIFDQGEAFNVNIGPNGAQYMMGSETEFCLRLKHHGFDAIYIPTAIVHHHIRREQYDESWWLDRMQRRGRGATILTPVPEVMRFLGAPKFLYKKMLVAWLRMVFARITFNRSGYVDRCAQYQYNRGLIHQYRSDFYCGASGDQM